MERRFFYYLILLNMISNIMMFTPEILIHNRFQGAVQSLLWAFPIGTLFIVVFTFLLNDFKGQSIVELLKEAFPKWLQKIILVYFLFLWFSTGILSISVFIYTILTFVNPHSNSLIVAGLLGGFVSLGATMKSDKVLYFLEIILAMALPFLAFILYKTLVNPYFSWTSVFQMMTYANRLPNYNSLSAATYIYSGYANMVVFNKCFSKKTSFKHLWLIGVLGLLVSLHTFFIPIGFHGTLSVGAYQFPWVATADSVRMTYGIVERLIYPFLLLYTIISLINSIIHLHVSLEFIKGLLPSPFFWKGKRKWVWPALFLSSCFLINSLTTELEKLSLSILWLDIRLPSEGVLLIILFVLKRRLRHAKKT